MDTGNIKRFDLFKIERGKQKLCQCKNPHYEIDTTNRLVQCIDCGAVVDAFDALLILCNRFDEYKFALEKYQESTKIYREAADKQFKRYIHEKALTNLYKNYRDGLYPTCPVCEKVFDPAKITCYTRLGAMENGNS